MPHMKTQIWDVGETEKGEKLIDKAIRLLLVHPRFGKKIWENARAIEKLYNDNTFYQIVSQIRSEVIYICTGNYDNTDNDDDTIVELPQSDSRTSEKLDSKYNHLVLNSKELKKLHNMFCQGFYSKQRQLCLWSFLVALACTIVE